MRTRTTASALQDARSAPALAASKMPRSLPAPCLALARTTPRASALAAVPSRLLRVQKVRRSFLRSLRTVCYRVVDSHDPGNRRAMGHVYVGCSGWNYAHWRDVFYPRGLGSAHWLEHYAQHFETVEVNAHVKRLRDLGPGWRRFHERIEPLADARKLGPVLWQLPENFHRDDDRLADALEALPPGRHCVEFRHESWFCSEVEKILRNHRVALVIGDEPTRGFQTHARPAGWTYVRFHRGRGEGRELHAEPASGVVRPAAQLESPRRRVRLLQR